MGLNDDLIGELLADEEVEEGAINTTEDVNALKAQVEELQKEKLGLLAATKEERRKRQERDMRLSKMEGAINGILSQRQQQGIESVSVAEAAEAKRQGLPVVYDDEGNGWIDQDQLNELMTPYQKEIMNLKKQLQLTDSRHTALDEAEKVRQSIISEDEQYGPASNRYRAARKWVEDAVQDFAKATGRTQPMTSGEALSQVFDKSLRNEFSQEFEGLDIFDIVTAEDSEDHFRRTLASISKTMNPEDVTPTLKAMDDRFQRVLRKPSNLGNTPNAKAGQLSVVEKLGSMPAQDIMDLSDAQVDALMKAMAKETEY